MTFIAVISPRRELISNLQQTLRKGNFVVLGIQTTDEIARYTKSQPIHFILYDDASTISITDVQQRINRVSSIDIPIIVLSNVDSNFVDLYRRVCVFNFLHTATILFCNLIHRVSWLNSMGYVLQFFVAVLPYDEVRVCIVVIRVL